MTITISSVYANEIDKLNSIEDVERFLIKKVDKQWKEYAIFDLTIKDTNQYGKGRFFKEDLDKNGLTDLIINGYDLFAVIDKGNGKYVSHRIDRGTFTLDKYTLLNIIHKAEIPLLIITGYNQHLDTLMENSIIDTLIFKFNSFIEYSELPKNIKIDTLKFSTSRCFGTCPVFEIFIQPDKTVYYNAIQYNKKKGKFKSTLDTNVYNEIVSILSYINLTTLKDSYSVDWTDDQTVNLEIVYDNRQTKKIRDYGAIGTFGLQNIYRKLFALRKSQKWKKTKEKY